MNRQKMESKFKVGDRVKIAFNKSAYYRGKTGVVTRAIPQPNAFPGLESTGIYKVKLDGNSSDIPNWANDDDLVQLIE